MNLKKHIALRILQHLFNCYHIAPFLSSLTRGFILCIIVQVLLTPDHLAIVMEYASGGELFERICNAGRFSEDEVTKL